MAPQQSEQRVTSRVPLNVTLRDGHNQAVAAPANVNVKVEIKAPSGKMQIRDVQIKAGQSSAIVDWQPTEAGVTRLKAREADNRLLDGADAILIKPAPPAGSASGPSSPAVAPKPKPKKPKRHAPAPAGPQGALDPGARWHVMLTQGITDAATPGDPAAPYIDMQVSARDIGGIFADGAEYAKIDVFYVTSDGSDAPADINIWFHWQGGEVSPQPLILKKGESHAEARWTAQAAVEGTLSIAAISPFHPIKAESASIKVRFVQPVKAFKMAGPSVLSLIDIGDLTAYFEDFGGHVINPGIVQTVSFSPDSTLIAVDPLQRQLQPGDVDVHTTLTPKAFSGVATVRASTLGFEPQTYTVRITWRGVLLWCVVGGLLGGFMRFLRSRGTLWKRLIVGLVVGALGVLLYVYGFLPATSSRVLHNLIAVPVAALLAGWLGLELLDKVQVMSFLTGHASTKR